MNQKQEILQLLSIVKAIAHARTGSASVFTCRDEIISNGHEVIAQIYSEIPFENFQTKSRYLRRRLNSDVIDRFRRAHTERKYATRESVHPPQYAHSFAEEAVFAGQFVRALDSKLNQGERAVFEVLLQKGYQGPKEIAETLGIPLGTTKSRLNGLRFKYKELGAQHVQ